jgi:hypothetical protein
MDNDFLHINDVDEQEAIRDFDKALQKKQFQGKKGKMLLELQKSYKDDKRFTMNKNFKNDLDVSKVPINLKNMSYAFNEKIVKGTYQEKDIDLEIKEERNKNYSILSSILTNEEFLKVNNKKTNNPKNLIIKRFDPSLNIGNELVREIKSKEEVKAEKVKNTIKLDKGVGIRKKSKKDLNLTAREKDLAMRKVMDEANQIKETKIEINYKSFKSIFHTQEENNFCLFSNEVSKKEPMKDVKTSSEPLEVIESEDLLHKKRLRTKAKNQQKKIKRKQQKEEMKIKSKEADKDIEKKFKTTLLEEHEKDKVNEYLRLVNLVRSKNKKN